MNKKALVIFLLVLFIPTIIAAAWFFSVSGKTYTPSNVANVTLKAPDGTEWVYTEEGEKEFFTTLATNLKSIEKQEFSPDVWTLYELSFERTFDSSVYFLCLSANAKNCLAYDADGNWYRINVEDARAFLIRSELEGLYTNSTHPELSLVVEGKQYKIPARHYDWNYLLADGTFSADKNTNDDVFASDVTVSASRGFEFHFDIFPDWCDVKIFDGDTLVHSGEVDALKKFSYTNDAVLRALVTCEWYKDDSKLFYGTTISEFYFDYDVKATAACDKEKYYPGEVIYIELLNSDNDAFELITSIKSTDKFVQRTFGEKTYIALPIASDNKIGEYSITLKSPNTTLELKVNIDERAADIATFSVQGITSDEFDNALKSLADEIGLDDYSSSLTEPLWKDGFVTPVKKYDGEKQLYWISPPVYRAQQIVNGTEISTRNFGIHYVKSVELQYLSPRAIADAVVAFAGTTTAYGNTVVLDHGFGLFSLYGCLDNCNFTQGDSVTKGTIIGKSVDTTMSVVDGEFVFAVIQDGVFINPYTVIIDPSSHEVSEIVSPPEIF